jgi:signal peptidase I
MSDEEQTSSGGLVETIKTIVYALLIAGVFRTVFYQPFWIPTGSMKETLLIGDFLFVNKMAYGYSYASCPSIPFIGLDARKLCGVFDGDNNRFLGGEPERGDVVVFRHPTLGSDYIKRLVGLPGDRIQVTNGVLIINGEPAPQQPDGEFVEIMGPQGPQGVKPRCKQGAVGDTAECIKDRFVETFPDGSTHKILNIGNSPREPDNTRVFLVPEKHYFFMGDNRDNSLDSRASPSAFGGGVGFVPYEDIIGRADRIMFSSGGRSMFFFWTWRADRFLKGIE